ncbi:MAG: hypothetical protein ACRDSR_10075 [Pseudonocardiaceae bacterium]
MTCPVVLAARYRAGVNAELSHPAHLLPTPVCVAAGPVGALCGALLWPRQLETVQPGQGAVCSMCTRQQATAIRLPPADARTSTGEHATGPDGTTYSALGWPVHLRGDHVVLPLRHDTAAHVVPVELVETIMPILTSLDRPVAVLLHPDAPGNGIVITGEPYGVPLPWPDTVQTVSGMLVLPPSETPHGPVSWWYQAPAHALGTYREIDIFAAVRKAGHIAQPQQS